MLSGRRLDILDPSPLDVEIEDIAHGLARVARWNGQTTGPLPFNVAQHSVIVTALCASGPRPLKGHDLLAALLHDAPEYVIGDMISPFKAALGARYKGVERGLQRAIHLRFGLPADLPPATEKRIKRADRVCAYFEATQIAGFGKAESRKLFGDPRPHELTIEARSAEESQALYLEAFATLTG
jgi:5'-deoxynucleotidase YfbR-like HD superfamily hydrolase